MLDWKKIKTVLLDMDGTLLDLHFDTYFWLEHLPLRFAEKHSMPFTQAQSHLKVEINKVAGQLEWYCLDYWAAKLDLPIVELKREIEHKISIRPDSIPFLDALKAAGKEVILLTNAHPDSLSLKIEKTALDSHIDCLISTHKYGVTKESQLLWQKLQADIDFDNNTTLFVDDSIPILDSAKTYGIKYLLAVANPDSSLPAVAEKQLKGYPYITDYRDIIPNIHCS